MAKKNRKLKLKPQQKIFFKKIFCSLVMLAGLYYLHSGLVLMKEKQADRKAPRATVEVRLGENAALPGEKVRILKRVKIPAVKQSAPALKSARTDQFSGAEAFLYEEPEKIQVIAPEEASPILWEEALAEPAEMPLSHQAEEPAGETASPAPQEEEPAAAEPVSPAPAAPEAVAEKPAEPVVLSATESQENLERVYEEKLPDDIIDEDGPYTHFNHTDLKSLQIIPYKKPLYFGDTPVVAVIIDDMGISSRRTGDILKLKAPITASFLTYGRKLEQQVATARKAGHEVMIHVPMEAQSNLNTAPDVLTTAMDDQELEDNLNQMLQKFHDIRGVNNHMGSKLTEDRKRMEVIMKVLQKNHLFFLDSKTSAKSQAEAAAKAQKVAYAHRHVFLDNQNNKEYILKQLSLTEKLARKNGYAVAIGHPKSGTFQALQEWLPTLKEKNIRLVHVSEIVEVLNPAKF